MNSRLSSDAADELTAWYETLSAGERMAFWLYVNAGDLTGVKASIGRSSAFNELAQLLIKHGLATLPGDENIAKKPGYNKPSDRELGLS